MAGEYMTRKRAEYAKYVKAFFHSEVEEIRTGIAITSISKIKQNPSKDITSLQTFDTWMSHNI